MNDCGKLLKESNIQIRTPRSSRWAGTKIKRGIRKKNSVRLGIVYLIKHGKANVDKRGTYAFRLSLSGPSVRPPEPTHGLTMRAELIGHYQPCMTEIYLHIDARMADYIRTHPYMSINVERADILVHKRSHSL